MNQDDKKETVGILYDLIIYETKKAWLLANKADEEENNPSLQYSQEGDLYNKEEAIWFPKSKCKLKNLAKEAHELHLPIWLAESNNIIDDCYGLEEIPNEDLPFNITAADLREPDRFDSDDEIPF